MKNIQGYDEWLAEGRTMDDAFGRALKLTEDEVEKSSGKVNDGQWKQIARAMCQKVAVPFEEFVKWLEARDFRATMG